MSGRADDQWVYGVHAVSAALQRRANQVAEICVLSVSVRRLSDILDQAKAANIPVREVAREELDLLSRGGNHQGIAAQQREIGAAWNESALENLLTTLSESPLLLVLDGVQDPHNLGACLRTADAAGVHAVIAPRDRATGLTATVRKVACGAAESVPFVQVTNLARALRRLKDAGIWLVGASGEADTSLYQTDMRGSIALVMGAEGKGLRRLTQELCDYLVRIPMRGQVASLNVSVATAVCLYEAMRQRMPA